MIGCHIFNFFPNSGISSCSFEGSSKFPFLRMVNSSVEAYAFISFFLPLMSLLSLHAVCLGGEGVKSTEKSISSTDR